jgi:hypothetical protein
LVNVIDVDEDGNVPANDVRSGITTNIGVLDRLLLNVTLPAPDETVVPAVFAKVATNGAAVVNGLDVLLNATSESILNPAPAEREIKKAALKVPVGTQGVPAVPERD